MLTLFPKIKPYNTQMLSVDAPHQIYVEESGNPKGIPVIFVHGGPGGGCDDYHRCFFDPELYRIILFDQRGCGRSVPHASLENNTTQALVSDMEVIRTELGVEKWLVFGGSWGSTLGLVYAQTHPERVHGLILRGIFLCRSQDIHWFYQDGASRIFPDHWQKYLQPIPEDERDDMLSAYHKRLTGENELTRMAAAKAWSIWEGRCSTLLPSKNVVDHFSDPHVALSMARIECHYFVNNSFLEPNQIIQHADRLAGIPGVIVHGRYDVVCPIDQAWDLHHAWSDSRLEIIPDSGHSASEKATVDALVRATNDMAVKLG